MSLTNKRLTLLDSIRLNPIQTKFIPGRQIASARCFGYRQCNCRSCLSAYLVGDQCPWLRRLNNVNRGPRIKFTMKSSNTCIILISRNMLIDRVPPVGTSQFPMYTVGCPRHVSHGRWPDRMIECLTVDRRRVVWPSRSQPYLVPL